MTALEHAAVGPQVLEPATRVSESVKPGWARSYIRRLAVTDACAIVVSVAVAQLVRFGADLATFRSEMLVYSYTAVSAALILAWFSALILFRSREPRVVGTGVEEFRRVGRASTALFGTVAIISFLLKLEVARGYLAVALPLGLLSLLLTRWLWRRWLAKERSEGRFHLHGARGRFAQHSCCHGTRIREGHKPPAIESLGCVFLVGELAGGTLSMLTDMRCRSLAMRPTS